MANRLDKHHILIAIAALLAVAGVLFHIKLARSKPGRTPVATEGMIAALGGLRSIAAEAVWFRIDRLQEEGRFVELSQLASTLAFLEPHTPEVWCYAAWNLAYNISIMMPTLEDRWRWVEAALKLLRDEGLKMNPDDPVICRELAWMFQNKIGADLDSAGEIYRRNWREKMTDVIRRRAWDEVGMTIERIEEIEKIYGPFDWREPLTSAIYWAYSGLKGDPTGRDKNSLEIIIGQCLATIERKRLGVFQK